MRCPRAAASASECIIGNQTCGDKIARPRFTTRRFYSRTRADTNQRKAAMAAALSERTSRAWFI